MADKWARWLHDPCGLGDSPPLHSGGQDQIWARKWARWLHNPCRQEGPHRFRAGGKFRSGPQVGKVAT